MVRVICIASGKGGVGKTTVVSNLSSALARFGKRVIAVDANLSTSNLGLHLGIPLYPVTLQDVLQGRARIRDAVYFHSEGFRLIPSDISIAKLMSPKPGDLVNNLYKLLDDADFILLDTAAGLGDEALSAVKAAEELLIVTNPEVAALTEALKLGRIAGEHETRNLGVVLNRVKNEPHEIGQKEAEEFLGMPILGKIHEDYEVRKSIAEKITVVSRKPRSLPAREFMNIAAQLAGEYYKMESPLFARLFGWFR